MFFSIDIKGTIQELSAKFNKGKRLGMLATSFYGYFFGQSVKSIE